ncbi:MAG: D-glycero-beta-D-manno-heptose 1-phosphate adenylyltransferase [Rhodospirillales bacterium]|nr:D-glycero-beta-D-manno-heptose 1-phosphate adenylyltransferase [Rhodospirillales bacterium]
MTAGPDLLAAMAGQRVVVLGDAMLDRYVAGEVRRISPEAPIPVLRARERREVAGGAANAALNVASLGGQAVLVAAVGRDEAAAGLRAALAGVETVFVEAARPTTVKTRFVAGGQQMLRLDEEEAGPVDAATEAGLLAATAAALAGARALILSDYAKGVLTDRVLAGAIAAARAAGVPVIVDPKRQDFSAYAGATVVAPNALEVARATGLAAGDDAAAAEACRAALLQARAEAILLKRSEKGLTLLAREGQALHVPTRAREVADVSGAGDTLVAAFALALAAGADMADAARLANEAAGLAVAHHGTAAVTRGELAQVLRRDEALALEDKIADETTALARIAAWRAAGLAVGFTNGCFDLIHPGHVHLLARARAACDRLVVALNTDASVKRLKGPDRPVQSETARATVMASIASADLVVLFEEDTPERLIRAVAPDVLIKGSDYTLATVVGADFVQAHGGRVVLIPLEAGHSTTATISRIHAST